MFAEEGMKKIKILFFGLFFCTLTSAAAADHNDDWLRLGVVPYKSPRTVVELYNPIASLLMEKLGKRVRVVTADGYEQYLQRVYAKKYDIIVLGSTFYFKAHDRAGYEAVARGFPPFRAGIIVRKDSGIDTLEQLRGKTMAAVNVKDRSGYKLQEMALRAKGIDPESDVDVHFRGKFDSVIYAVLSGQDDAGAIRLDALQKPAFTDVKKKLKIIYTSQENPQFPFAVRSDMDPVMREKIGTVLASITMDRPETAAILKSLNILGFDRVTCDDLELLRLERQEEARRVGVP